MTSERTTASPALSTSPKPVPGGADGTTAPVVFGSVAATCSANLDRPASVLAIGAHPDDIEFGCGATLAKWAAAGSVVHHLVCTDGSKGTWDAEQDPAQLVMMRQGEQRRAAAALGATGQVVFLGWTDGELDSGLRQRWEVAYWIRRLQPTVVIGHDPWKRYRLHPDHRHAGLLTVEAIVAARDPLFFPEQHLAPHRPSALLLFEADEVDHIEDVTGFADTKFDGLFAHESQFRSTMKIDPAATPSTTHGVDPSAAGSEAATQRQRFVDRITDRLAQHGALAGFTHGEAYKLMSQL